MSKKHRIKAINPTTPIKEARDTSPRIPQRDKIKNELHIYERPDFTEKQKEFIRLALDKNTKIIFCDGKAGTGKTTLAVYCSLKLLSEKKVSDLIYIRSAVESSPNGLGFLPGELEVRLSPYMAPLMDKLEELLPKGEIQFLHKDNRLQAIPTNFLRGASYNCKTIVVDESQNMTEGELITAITRIGEFSKLFVIGDSTQCDIGNRSGFKKLINVFSDQESRNQGIYSFYFSEDDCVRSGLCKFILEKLMTLKK